MEDFIIWLRVCIVVHKFYWPVGRIWIEVGPTVYLIRITQRPHYRTTHGGHFNVDLDVPFTGDFIIEFWIFAYQFSYDFL